MLGVPRRYFFFLIPTRGVLEWVAARQCLHVHWKLNQQAFREKVNTPGGICAEHRHRSAKKEEQKRVTRWCEQGLHGLVKMSGVSGRPKQTSVWAVPKNLRLSSSPQQIQTSANKPRKTATRGERSRYWCVVRPWIDVFDVVAFHMTREYRQHALSATFGILPGGCTDDEKTMARR